ncbi:PREDICTED: bombesin receptor-activated protein C6orf89 homolog [Dipodomys ordii]|uniref:Bombesin receptor-activated protein C6orf89 homolog n=1 Tax=Dipodomys ordii TaxID=10020 RepID=A0A1S3G886_DIPOR|nr:PREDICTED: bombesin receptor-activated protein C6orf89 homolog [Dipodomys ordii]
MDLAANEISIYDKLSETVDLVRQTGHQCGMSEKAIEKFIRQLLEKNEPQRGPPQYPLLIAVYKLHITVYLYPKLTTCIYFPTPHLDFDFSQIWTNNCEQNRSETVPADCTGCAHQLPLKVVLVEDVPKNFDGLHPLVIKTGQPVMSEEMQHFLCQYPEATEGFTEGVFAKWWRCFPERWFPFPYPWRRPLNRSQILHELFPVFNHLPFPKDASLKKCFRLHPEPVVGSKMHKVHDLFTLGSGEAMLQLIPPFQCRRHCQTVAMPIESGDIGYASAPHWKAYIVARGTQPLVICDGTTLSAP